MKEEIAFMDSRSPVKQSTVQRSGWRSSLDSGQDEQKEVVELLYVSENL